MSNFDTKSGHSTPDISTLDNSTPTFQPPYKSRLATLILQRMEFNLYLFARALSVKSYCLHYVFKLFVRKICVR